MKKIKVILLAALILLFGLSISALAEDSQAIDLSQGEKYVVKITDEAKEYFYSGKEIKPSVTVVYYEDVEGVPTEYTLNPETDYTVSYDNNVNVGVAEIKVNGKGAYTGELSKTFKIKLGIPVVSSSSLTYNSVKISWNKITGVAGYQIYRSTSKDSGYKRVKSVAAGTTSYVDKGIACGTIYYYKVRGYCKVDGVTKFGTYSAVKSQRVRPATAKVTAVSRVNYKSLKVTWEKVAGATGYAIYRSTSKNGEYTRIGSVKKGTIVSYTDTKCVCGRRFYYKVAATRVANGTTWYGLKSEPKSNYTKPSKVVVSANTTYNSTKITLKWKKTPTASGYEIYRSTLKNSGYKKFKTITSGSTLSWTHTGLVKGRTYYYKVRAYRNIDGKTVYGAFSNPYKKTKAGWRYVDGYKLYYNASGKLVKDVSGIIGKQDSYVIKVNKKMNTVTVYAKDGKNGYIIPVKAFVCSTGYATPTGTFYTPQKLRWHELMGPCWGQWCTRITGGILFHSVWYRSPNNNNTLSVSSYNKLGTTASHGCVRLTAGDAKWIYDNCDLKTKVIIYNSSDPGPLGKPTAYKLKSNHTWDPTDPNMKAKCKKKGCH